MKAERKQIGVRYCGGCNARYDRVALVQRLKEFFPAEDFVPAQEGGTYAAALVVCGCPSRCASASGLAVPPRGLIVLGGFEDLLPARDQLWKVLQGQKIRVLDHRDVLAVLPHRPPMLFIDEVTRLVPGTEAVATYRVAADLPVLSGHFPERPVFPGVLTVEAMAQTAAVLMMTTGRYAETFPLFAEIDRARFRREILPGDTLELHVSVLEERTELGMVTCRGQAFANGKFSADAEIRLAFRNKKTTKG